MRIKRNDVTCQVYTATQTYTSEGVAKNTWGLVATVQADLQPVSNPAVLTAYGVQSGEMQTVFCDYAADFPLNAVVNAKASLWQVVSVVQWYGHAEALLKLYKGTL